MRYIDLFGGVGGFRLGIERAKTDWECVWYCDNDRYAVQTYNKNFGENYEPSDITKVDAKDIPKHDIICAGFPCQSFSIAGKRKGFGDTRGTLFFEICRIVGHHKPKLLFLENVKGLLNHDKGRTFRTILQSLNQLGYDAEWQVLNSKDFGVLQNRERVFIIANLRGESRPKVFPLGEISEENFGNGEEEETMPTIDANYGKGNSPSQYEKGRMRGIIYENKSEREISRIYSVEGLSPTLHLKTGGWQEPKIAIPILTPDRINKRQNERRFKEDGEPSFTLTGQDIHGVVISHSPRSGDSKKGGTGLLISNEHSFTIDRTPHSVAVGMKIRKLTPLECERLQGFPDNWTQGVSDTQRYRQMGNAVTVNVIKSIVERLDKW